MKIIANKIAKNIGVIRRISHVISPKRRLNLYHTMVSPYMSYVNTVWASNYESRMHCFTILQKRTIRIIGGESYYVYTHLRYEETNAMQFVTLNNFLTGIFMYKFMNNLVPGSFKNFLLKL